MIFRQSTLVQKNQTFNNLRISSRSAKIVQLIEEAHTTDRPKYARPKA